MGHYPGRYLVVAIGTLALVACSSEPDLKRRPDTGPPATAADGSNSPTDDIEDRDTVVVPWARRLDEETLQNVEVKEEALVFTGAAAERAESYRPLDIVVSESRHTPFLRRITDIERNQKRVVLETRQTSLTETLYKATYTGASTQTDSSPLRTRRQGQSGQNASVTEKFNVAGSKGLTASARADASFGFSPSLNFKIKPKAGKQPKNWIFKGVRSCTGPADCHDGEICHQSKCSYKANPKTYRYNAGKTVCDQIIGKLDVYRNTKTCQGKWDEYWNSEGRRSRGQAACVVPQTRGARRVKPPYLSEVEWAKKNCHGSLKYFEFNMNLSLRAALEDVSLSANASASLSSPEDNKVSQALPNPSVERWITVGWLPVLLTFNYEPGINYSFSIGGSGKVELTNPVGLKNVSVSSGVYYYASPKWRRRADYGDSSDPTGDWFPDSETNLKMYQPRLKGSANLSAEVAVSASHRFELLIYRTAGPYLTLTAPQAKAGFNVTTSGKTCSVGAKMGMSLGAGITSQIPICGNNCSIDVGKKLWSACSEGYCGSTQFPCIKKCFTGDCNSNPPMSKEEICYDGKDNDNDGKTDCADADCPSDEMACDSHDNDCDGQIDEGLKTDYWPDKDGDGFGAGFAVTTCKPPSSGQHPYVTNDRDCDDSDPSIHPKASEKCGDGKDNDCDGKTDESSVTCYPDGDGDGWGQGFGGSYCKKCSNVSGAVKKKGDCDDSNPDINPDAAPNESSPGCYKDADGDNWGDDSPSASGVDAGTDCNDSDFTINPGANEVCNGKDDDCDGQTDETANNTCYPDGDGDGWGQGFGGSYCKKCSNVSGAVKKKGDCDDSNPDINPDAAPNESSPGCYKDADGDNWGDDSPSASGVDAGTDCNDSDFTINPGANEVCNGKDDDCDGQPDENVNTYTCYPDGDGDGWGQGFGGSYCKTCSNVSGAAKNKGDCDDSDPSIHPTASEDCTTFVDQDCDGNPRCGDSDCDGKQCGTLKYCKNGVCTKP